MADGSIVFDTKIKTDDVKPQLKKLKAQVSALNAQLKTADSNRNKLYNAWEKSGFKDNGLRAKLAEADGEAKRLREDIERANEAIAMTKAAPSRKTTAGDAVDGISDASSKIGKQISGSAPKGSFFQKLKNGFSTAGNTIKGFLGSLMGGNKGLDTFNGRLKTGIGTVFKYALGIRSLYVLFNKLRQFLSAGIGNLQQYSQQTANSINALQTSATFAGNALAAAFEPILSAVVPILTTLIDALATACNWIARFFAMLGGKSTYTKAVKGANQYAKATNGVAGAAKKATDAEEGQLAAIDEFNDISKQQNSGAGGGSGGGGGGGMDYGSMFETAQVAGDSLIDQMKAAIDAGDWEGAGKLLADKVNSLFEGIQWESLGTQFGTNLAHVIEFGYGFISNLDTAAWGQDLAQFVNGTIAAMNVEEAWRDLGGMLVRIFTNAIDFVGGFLLNLDYGQIAIALSQGLEGAMDELTTWLNGIDWAQVGAQAWQNLKDFFGNLDYAGLATSFFTLLGTAFRSLALLLGGFFGNIGEDIKNWWDTSIQGENWIETAGNLLKAIGQGFVNIAEWVQENIIDPFMNALIGEDKWSEIKQAASDIWDGFTEGLQEFFDDPIGWIDKHIVQPFVNGFKSLFGIHSPSTVMKELGGYLVDGITEGISGKTDDVRKVFGDIKDAIADVWDKTKKKTSETWENIKGGLGTAWDTIKDNAGTAFGTVKDSVSTKWDEIKNNTSTTWDSVKSGLGTVWGNVKDNASTTFGTIKDKITTKWGEIKSSSSDTWGSIKDSISTAWGKITGNTKTSADDVKSKISSGNADNLRNIASFTSDSVGKASDLANGFITNIRNGMSSLGSTMSQIMSAASSPITNVVQSAGNWGRDLINNFVGGISSIAHKVKSTVKNVADTISSYLHFSEPDIGPLANFHTWGPDFMNGFADDITASMPVVDRAMSKLADMMSSDIEPFVSPDIATGKITPAAFGSSDVSGNRQNVMEKIQELIDRIDDLNDARSDNRDILNALSTLIDVVRAKKLLTSDVGRAAADYMNSEYDRTGEPILKGV